MNGDLDEIHSFLLGISWARRYDDIVLKISSPKKRNKKEQDIRNTNLIDVIKR
jgi:hypothetical protein